MMHSLLFLRVRPGLKVGVSPLQIKAVELSAKDYMPHICTFSICHENERFSFKYLNSINLFLMKPAVLHRIEIVNCAY